MKRTSAARRPWLAGLLQIVTPGLGNLYSGHPLRGLILQVAVQCIGIFLLLVLLWVPSPLNLLIPVAASIAMVVLVVVDGVRCARAANPDFQLARYNRWYVYILVLTGVSVANHFLIEIPARTYVVQAFQTPSPSMEPAILPGDHVIVAKSAYAFSEPKRGDLAIYGTAEFPETIFIKRIVGMPGETIEIRNRVVFLNGTKLDEPYVQFVRPTADGTFPGDSVPPTVIPAKAYFVLGDNRDNSNDSRFAGPVLRPQLLGKAKTIYFSWGPEDHKIRWNRIGKTLH